MGAEKEKTTGKIARRVLAIVAIVVVVLVGIAAWYVSDYYRADSSAVDIIEKGGTDTVVATQLDGGSIAFAPKGVDTPSSGVIFYPGGKVQPEAYAPLMVDCAEHGLLCVLVKPPFNLAFLDVNAADAACRQFPDVESWVVAGHSLGGVAAADYVSRHQGDVRGIAFLAAYPVADLSGFGEKAVSILGTNDGVLNRGKYEESAGNWPTQVVEVEIEGGNHSNFGNYGDQAGDGVSTITRDEQQSMTAEAIAELALAA